MAMIFWEMKRSSHKVIMPRANPVRKNIKNNAGYERHVRNVHTSKNTIAQISDHAIADLLSGDRRPELKCPIY